MVDFEGARRNLREDLFHLFLRHGGIRLACA